MTTEHQEKQNWRNWCLKSTAASIALLERIPSHCPEVDGECQRVLDELRLLDKKIREGQPKCEPHVKHVKMRRICIPG